MALRPNTGRQESATLSFDHAAVTADTTIKLQKFRRRFRVDHVSYVNPTGLVEHASDYFTVQLLKGSTVVASISTNSAGAGTNSIAADTFTDLTLSTTDADLVFAPDDIMALKLDETGTATLPAGRIVVEGRYV